MDGRADSGRPPSRGAKQILALKAGQMLLKDTSGNSELEGKGWNKGLLVRPIKFDTIKIETIKIETQTSRPLHWFIQESATDLRALARDPSK